MKYLGAAGMRRYAHALMLALFPELPEHHFHEF